MASEVQTAYTYEQLLGDDASLKIVEDFQEGRLDDATSHRIESVMLWIRSVTDISASNTAAGRPSLSEDELQDLWQKNIGDSPPAFPLKEACLQPPWFADFLD